MTMIRRLVGILFVFALLICIPLAVTAQESTQLTHTSQQRCFIIGIGYFWGEQEDKIWVNYFDPVLVLYHGRLAGPNYVGFMLSFHHFRGFLIPINHCLTPIIGRIDYDPMLLC